MKEIIKNYYTLIYGITGGRTAAYRLAIFFVSIVSFTAISGLTKLLKVMLPFSTSIREAFLYPFGLATWSAMFVLLYLLYPMSQVSVRNPNVKPSYLLVILSASVAILLYGYGVFMHMSNL